MNSTPKKDLDQHANRIAYLVAGYIRKTLTEAEHDELDAWVEESDQNMLLFEELTDEKNIQANLEWIETIGTQQKLQSIIKQLSFTPPKEKKKSVNLWYYSAAAAVLIIIASLYIISSNSTSKDNNDKQFVAVNSDILPASGKVTLTLSNGETINLQTTSQRSIKTEGGSNINTTDSLVSYSSTNTSPSELIYNTLSTTRGVQYQVILSDGTKVWLNAASSLKYPVAFNGDTRSVQLTGEAYFEVAKNKDKPFVVSLADQSQVKVLGTHFNILSYSGDAAQEITLMEGSVEVQKKQQHLPLEPGQQAIVKDSISLANSVDMESVLGWKQELFVFHDADIKTIFHQVSKWYDIEVIYQYEKPLLFNATISRREPLSKLLHLLELTGKVHFKTQNNKVYVL